jgi:Ca-activated chloride channel homolog
MTARTSLRLAPLLAAATLVAGCAMSNISAMAPGDLGVTPGGAQDIGVARAIIEQGGIPDQVHFRAEGLFSEHDLPMSGSPCDALLCPQAAASPIDPIDGSGPMMLVQVGFGTNVTSDTFERLPLNLALVVDISGSMSGGKLDAVQDALTVLSAELDAADRVALIAFDDVTELRLASRMMDGAGRSALNAAIGGLQTDGGTNIEAGLQMGYGQVSPQAGVDGVSDRVMLFTDAQPNVGATDLDSFLGMVRYYSATGIGISVFGVGLDLGAELAQEVSQTRGGNYFYLADDDAIAQVFDEEFDYIVTPLAYDLEVTVAASAGLEFAGAWGAPLDEPGPEVEFGASTLFLSARDGGIGVALAGVDGVPLPDEEVALATFSLSYQPVGADEPVLGELDVAWGGGSVIDEVETDADAVGVYKMAVLLDEYLALTAAAEFCDELVTVDEAMTRIEDATDRIDAVAIHLLDADLSEEAALLTLLAQNVSQGGQCWTDDSYQEW